MGQDKALLTLGGEPLVKIAARKLKAVCAEVAIAGGAEELARFGRVIPDNWPGCGPLGGIVSALEQSSFEWNLFLPVDAPFVPVFCLNALLLGAAGYPWCLCDGRSVRGEATVVCGVFAEERLECWSRNLRQGDGRLWRRSRRLGRSNCWISKMPGGLRI